MYLYKPAGMLVWGMVVLFFLIFGRLFESLYRSIETRFVAHLSEKERSVVEERSRLPHLAPWEATLTEFSVSEYSPLVMRTLQESNLRQDHGVTVAIIQRGEERIIAPKSQERLYPCDRLYLIGTFDQLAAAKEVIEKRPDDESAFDDERFGMIPLRLTLNHEFVGKSIRDCGLRESVNGLIVGLERGTKRFLNPEPEMILECNDLIWLVGDKMLLKKL